jgi:hypothetical protein
MVPCVDRVERGSLVCARWRDIVADPAALPGTSCLVAKSLCASRLSAVIRGHVDCAARLCAESTQSGRRPNRALYQEIIARDDVATLRVLGINESVLTAAETVGVCVYFTSAACLAYTIAQYDKVYMDILWLPWRCANADPVEHAACLAVVRASNHRVDHMGLKAATHGHAACLTDYVRTCAFNHEKVIDACIDSASHNGGDGSNGCLDAVCREAGAKLTYSAALRGRLDLLILLRSRGVPWHDHACAAATIGGHLDCLRYAHENDCPWDAQICHEALIYQRLDCFVYAITNGCDCKDHTIYEVVDADRVDYLRCVHQAGRPLPLALCTRAAAAGSVDCLRYAHENGFPWRADTCAEAAGGNRLDCLVYAHEHGCPWDERSLTAAIDADAVDCLRYMRDQGMTWDRRIYRGAHRDGHSKCLEYMSRYEECPLDDDDSCESDTDSDREKEETEIETGSDPSFPSLQDVDPCEAREPSPKRVRTVVDDPASPVTE